MLYAKKVRLALALLVVLVARIVEVLWWNLDSEIYRNTNNNRGTINNMNVKGAMHTHDEMIKLCTEMFLGMSHKLNGTPKMNIKIGRAHV